MSRRWRYEALSHSLTDLSLSPLDAPKEPLSPSYSSQRLSLWEAARRAPHEKFMGLFNTQELQKELLNQGILQRLAQNGHTQLKMVTETPATNRHRLRLLSPQGLVMELKIWREFLTPNWTDKEAPKKHSWPVVHIELMRLQNPLIPFNPQHLPPLPGQKTPGNGLAELTFTMLRRWSHQVGAAAICILPEFFHTAVIFDRYFSFLSPAAAAFFLRTRQLLLGVPPSEAPFRLQNPNPLTPKTHTQRLLKQARLSAASWVLELDGISKEGRILGWPTELQWLPITPTLVDAARSLPYQTSLRDHLKDLKNMEANPETVRCCVNAILGGKSPISAV